MEIDEQRFSIKDLENLSGVKAHTIRIWEQRYGFLKPRRSDTNIRYYTNDELKKLLNAALLIRYGFKISHISKMNDEQLEEKVLELHQNQALNDRLVNELITRMIELDVVGMEEILDHFILNKGIQKTMNAILFPFLERIGIMWSTNRIHPVHEHLVSCLIRQKLIVGIESLVNRQLIDQEALLFLPEDEYHELGLLYLYYLLKQRGLKIYYLGGSVPLNNIEYIVKQKNISLLFTHLTSIPPGFNLQFYVHQLSIHLKNADIYISGPVVEQIPKKSFPNIHLLYSQQELLQEIEKIFLNASQLSKRIV
ncbi:MAG: MerR family transcriptional regulator [Thermoflavifilum sp.]|nr:MerR family transcriptional regulator [Thermoflavifilum sp.]